MFSATRAALCLTRGCVRKGGLVISKPGNNVTGSNNRLTAMRKQHTNAKTKSAETKSAEAELFPPVRDTAAGSLGQGVLAGGATLGLGALCYYGLGLADKPGAIDLHHLWPQQVKDRVRDTYAYFGGALGITAAVAAATSRSPALMRLVLRNRYASLGAYLVLGLGSLAATILIPYKEGFGKKQLAWLSFSAVEGLMFAPLAHLAGPIVLKAVWMTAIIIGALSAGMKYKNLSRTVQFSTLPLLIHSVAVCAPNDQFLYMGGPLALGLGVGLAASLTALFLPGTAIGLGAEALSLYGGMILFGLFVLYDTQEIIHAAEHKKEYDPINSSLGIYLDTINIFIRVVQLLADKGKSSSK